MRQPHFLRLFTFPVLGLLFCSRKIIDFFSMIQRRGCLCVCEGDPRKRRIRCVCYEWRLFSLPNVVTSIVFVVPDAQSGIQWTPDATPRCVPIETPDNRVIKCPPVAPLFSLFSLIGDRCPRRRRRLLTQFNCLNTFFTSVSV